MAHRLIASRRSFDRILKNGLFTGNFNSLAQVQPRYSGFAPFLTQSSRYFSYEPPKTFDKPHHQRRDNNGRATKIDAEGGEDMGKNSRKINWQVGALVCFITFGISMCANMWWHGRKKSYEQISWDDFFENYLARGRVANLKIIDKKWLRFDTAPGAPAAVANTLRVRINSLHSHEIVALLAETLENAGKERKVEPENKLMDADVDKELELDVSLSTPAIAAQVNARRRTTSSTRSTDRIPKIV